MPAAKIPLSFAYRPGSYAYDLRQTTAVTVGAEGSTSANDTLHTIASLTYLVSANTGVRTISVTVDSLVIASVRDTTAPARRLAAPLLVQLPLVSTPTVPIDSTAPPSTCDSMEEAARALAGDAYVEIPVAVSDARSWSDSTSLVICRGGIPLTMTRVSHFQVVEVRESRDSTLARIVRQTSLVVTGSGTQGARRITVQGNGSSETAFIYDLRAGCLLESTGQSVLQLGFETIQQTEQVIQRSSSNVRLRVAMPAGS